MTDLTAEAAATCEASVSLTGPGRRGKTGRCTHTATMTRTLAVVAGEDVAGQVCGVHAKKIDSGVTLYRAVG